MRRPSLAGAAVLLLFLAACSGERQDYQRAEAAGTVSGWEEFLVRHPEGERATAARAQLATLHEEREWRRASTVDSVDAYQQYLRGYPNGHYASEALIRIANLNLASTPPGGPPETSPSLPMEAPAAPSTAATAPPAAKVAAARPAATAATAAKPASGKAQSTPGYRVQLGAFGKGSAAADRAWKQLLAKYPGEFAGRKPIIAAARSRDGKPLHRLQVAGYTSTAARAVCARLQAGGDACVIVAPAKRQVERQPRQALVTQ